MVGLLTTIHVLIAIALVLLVLLQSSKGGGMAGAFGGMGSQAAFGPRGTTTFLSKATVVLAVCFAVTSLALVKIADRTVGGGDSVLSGETLADPTESGSDPDAEGLLDATVPLVQVEGDMIPNMEVEIVTPTGTETPEMEIVVPEAAGQGASETEVPAEGQGP